MQTKFFAITAFALLLIPMAGVAGEYDPVDPRTWPDTNVVGEQDQGAIAQMRCSANDKSDCEQVYRYACEAQGKYAACDLYNAMYTKNGEHIQPTSASGTQKPVGNTLIGDDIEQRMDQHSKDALACVSGDKNACESLSKELDKITEETRVAEACLQGDKQACDAAEITIEDPRIVAACAKGDEKACEELGFDPAERKAAAACANGDGNACKELGIDPEVEKLAVACAQGEKKACDAVGMTEQMKLGDQINAAAEKKSDKACKMLLCMSAGGLTSPKQCMDGINAFFKIRKTKKGHFSPSRTASARKSRLNSCGDGSKSKVNMIIAKFGHLPRSPFGFY